MNSKTQTLDLLWNITSTHLIDKIRSGTATANDISNAIKFLDKGIIDELREASNEPACASIKNIMSQLPFDGDDLELPNQ